MSLKIWQDEVDFASVATLPENGNFKCVGNSFLSKKDPFAYSENKLILADGCAFDVYDGTTWRQITNRGDYEFDPVDLLDTGSSLDYGKDYYVYLVVHDAATIELKVSLNTTYPAGESATNTRKIGGFHVGEIRKVSSDGLWIPVDSLGIKFGANGIAWKDNVTTGIVPNSVWDLKNRPKHFMPGMAKVNNFWISIYQMSVDEGISFMASTNGLHVSSGSLKSAYGALPATGTEGLNGFNFNELASKQGMRLPSYFECCQMAFGAPQGLDNADTYGWTKTTNTARTYTGCSVNTSSGAHAPGTGAKPYAISAYNVVDTSGNVWEWCSDVGSYYESATFAWKDVLGANMGQAYLSGNTALKQLLFGGTWNHGAVCGPRAVNGNGWPWYVHVSIGARFACDSAC